MRRGAMPVLVVSAHIHILVMWVSFQSAVAQELIDTKRIYVWTFIRLQ
jgi:hypothetical protein